VFVICYSREIELRDFQSFIKKGIDHNELVIVFLEDCSKDKTYDTVKRSAKFLNDEILKKKGSIIFKPTEEWYHPDKCLNAEIFLKKWEILICSCSKEW